MSKGECLSLDKQIEYFTSTVTNDLPRNFRSKLKLSHYLSKSIFLLSIGSNDYILNYFKQEMETNQKGNPEEFADYLLEQLGSKIKVNLCLMTYHYEEEKFDHILLHNFFGLKQIFSLLHPSNNFPLLISNFYY